MRDDGGSAFPVTFADDDGDLRGMTLRDYFAAKAMPQIMAELTAAGTTYEYEVVAHWAYMLADAMLKERAK